MDLNKAKGEVKFPGRGLGRNLLQPNVRKIWVL